MGEIQTGFVLSASDQLVGEVLITRVAEVLGDAFVRAFAFDNATKEWQFYAKDVAEFSTLTTLAPGKPYLFLVAQDTNAMLNGKTRVMTCRDGNCWNTVVW